MEAENQDNTNPQAPNVGGLIAEVENKMSELMAWHNTQTSQFEEEKTRFEAELQEQRDAIKAEGEQQAQQIQEQAEQQKQAIEQERKAITEHTAQVEEQRIKLAALANKLRAEESAMSREWGEVQCEREAVQKQAAEVAKLREEAQDRAKAWLDITANELSEPLKLTETQSPDESHESHEGEHHHEAA